MIDFKLLSDLKADERNEEQDGAEIIQKTRPPNNSKNEQANIINPTRQVEDFIKK